MVLDMKIRGQVIRNPDDIPDESGEIYVDIAFGDDRRGFAGFHRLEVTYEKQCEKREVTLCYSSMACNPSVNILPLPGFMFRFHRWYGMCLFRDGVEMVLRK